MGQTKPKNVPTCIYHISRQFSIICLDALKRIISDEYPENFEHKEFLVAKTSNPDPKLVKCLHLYYYLTAKKGFSEKIETALAV